MLIHNKFDGSTRKPLRGRPPATTPIPPGIRRRHAAREPGWRDGENNIGPLPRLPGAIDQITDSVDVLTNSAPWPGLAGVIGFS